MLKAWITVQGSSEQLKVCYINVPTPTKKKIRYLVFKIIFVLFFCFTQSETKKPHQIDFQLYLSKGRCCLDFTLNSGLHLHLIAVILHL